MGPVDLPKREEMLCPFVRAQFPGSIEVVTLHNNTDIAYTVELNPEKPSLYSRTRISSICLCWAVGSAAVGDWRAQLTNPCVEAAGAAFSGNMVSHFFKLHC